MEAVTIRQSTRDVHFPGVSEVKRSIVLDKCDTRWRDEVAMARFAVEIPHHVHAKYEFWASRNNAVKKEVKEEKKKKEEEDELALQLWLRLVRMRRMRTTAPTLTVTTSE